LKSNFDSSFLQIRVFKSSFSAKTKSFRHKSISIASFKFSTSTTFISGTTEASGAFSFGTKIFFIHFSFAQIVAGKTLFIFLKSQFKDNSHKKILFSSNSCKKSNSQARIHTAIGKSKLGQDFLISAGAKFTVILEAGNFAQLDFKADLSLSLLSCTH